MGLRILGASNPPTKSPTAAFRARLVQQRGVGTAARKRVASLVIGIAKSLNGLGLCDIADHAEMREYSGKRPHCVTGKFLGDSIIDFIEQLLTAIASATSWTCAS